MTTSPPVPLYFTSVPSTISKSSVLPAFAAAALAAAGLAFMSSCRESSAKSMRPISESAGSRSNPSPLSRMIPSPEFTLTSISGDSISRDSISSSTAFTAATAPFTDTAASSSAISRLIQVFFMSAPSL